MKKYLLVSLLFILCFFPEVFSQSGFHGSMLISSCKEEVSLELEDAKLVDVLKIISQQTKLNFIAAESVRERKLSLYLEKVPLKEAADIIFNANGLAYEYYPESNMFVIKETGTPAIQFKAKVYRLEFARVSSSKLEKKLNDFSGNETASGALVEGGGALGGSDDEGGIKEAVSGVLSEFGKVTEDPVTNSLIVVDVPSQFPIIDEVIAQLDIEPLKVMIEVEMVDVSKQAIDNLGVSWPSALMSLDMTLSQRATSFPFGSGKGNRSGNTSSITISDATPSGWENVSWGTNHFGPTILTAVGSELILNFLKTQSDTKFLARPKIMTLSNQTAEIKITSDEAIGISKTTSEEGDVTYEIERSETGIKLNVTPQIGKNGKDITLYLEMIVKEAQDSGFTSASTALIAGTIKNPEERSAKAVVSLKDGQTLFMGGLIKEDVSDSKTKVPVLGDIPILGAIFRHRSKDKTERELMVFLTPHILGESQVLPKGIKFPAREQTDILKKRAVNVALDRADKK